LSVELGNGKGAKSAKSGKSVKREEDWIPASAGMTILAAVSPPATRAATAIQRLRQDVIFKGTGES
jgi:hypothetical protein